MKDQSNYPHLVKEAKELADALGVAPPPELLVQYGPPGDRFNQVLGAVAGLLARANEEFEPKKPTSKAEKKKE